MMLKWPRRFGSALAGWLDHLLRSDMRRSPFYRGIANVIIAWLLGSLVLALLAPLLEARGQTLPGWVALSIFAVALFLVFVLRRRKRTHLT
jgi:hypothetical protein